MILSLKRLILSNTILKNFSVLTLSNVLTQLLSVFVSIKIARSLSPLLFGTYNLLQLHISIFTLIASFGLKNIIIRSIARDKTIIRNVFIIAIILRVIGFVISVSIFFIYFLSSLHYDTLLFLLVIQCILSSLLFDVFEGVAFGLERMEFSGIITLLSTIVWLFLIVLIPESQLSLHLLFCLFVFFSSLKTLVYFFFLYKAEYLKGFGFEHLTKDQLIEFSKQAFPYYYLSLFTLLSNQIPILFLEYRSGVEQIGFFNIASKLLMPIYLIIDTTLAAIFPNLSRLFTTEYKNFIQNVKLVFIIISSLGIAGAFSITLFREEFIYLLYGKEYISSSLVLGYQSWYVAIYSVVCLIGTILSSINKQKELSYLSILCTGIQVPILWFGSQYGAQYLSAAFLVATIISFLIHLCIINFYLRNELSIYFNYKLIGLFIIGYLASSLIPVDLSLLYKVGVFIMIFFIGAYVMFQKYYNSVKKMFTPEKGN